MTALTVKAGTTWASKAMKAIIPQLRPELQEAFQIYARLMETPDFDAEELMRAVLPGEFPDLSSLANKMKGFTHVSPCLQRW